MATESTKQLITALTRDNSVLYTLIDRNIAIINLAESNDTKDQEIIMLKEQLDILSKTCQKPID